MTESQKKKAKEKFATLLKLFANTLADQITKNGEWTVKGFIDVFKNLYTISSDTKVVSKILEIHLFPYFLKFAHDNGYTLELATHQNYYPDITMISQDCPEVMFAVDLKTTFRNDKKPNKCNGFTLGSHGKYFKNRESTKNIQYPYGKYLGHFCLGIIYSKTSDETELEIRKLEELENIKSVISNFTFFAEEKWRIASDKSGSGNTANIGSIKSIPDILSGNGVFANAGEELFDDYWKNYGKIIDEKGAITTFARYLKYRNLSASLNNKK